MKSEVISFNCAMNNHSITMKFVDFIEVENPIIADISDVSADYDELKDMPKNY
jgi:hypothetical protein